jgi:hypothetical protein
MLWMFQRVNYGPLTKSRTKGCAISACGVVRDRADLRDGDLHGRLSGVFLKPMEPAVKRRVERIAGTPGAKNAELNLAGPADAYPPSKGIR